MKVSVVIPTHNPDRRRLDRTLLSLQQQSLATEEWEIVLVDNASDPAVTLDAAVARARVEREPSLGLSSARRRGILASSAPIVVFVDDDNVLARDYLANVVRLFASHPEIGALGGRSLPEFERSPEDWQREFLPLLAVRDLGDQSLISSGHVPPCEYPNCAPIGAGMAIRRAALEEWLGATGGSGFTDRRGTELTSAGDNDIILCALRSSWRVAYFPELQLTHLIPAGRLVPEYLARLNHGIQKSWVQVLQRHQVSPWPPIAVWTVPVRKLKAWFTYRAWSSTAARIRWRGACGHFEGRVQ